MSKIIDDLLLNIYRSYTFLGRLSQIRSFLAFFMK